MGKKRSSKKYEKKLEKIIITLIIIVVLVLIEHLQGYISKFINQIFGEEEPTVSYNIGEIPEYNGEPYVVINDNKPQFDEEDYNKEFEEYSELDNLGRCGIAYASISKKTMPASGVERESISSVYPSGWKNKAYKGLVEGDYLYNRCHLIGWQLGAENDNKLNLITGTRYLNVQGMLPFENQIAAYLKQKINKNNHVLYRVTPIYEGKNLVASGVQMEAYSVEDNGQGVCFNVYVYNVQPGIEIDYLTGDSKLADT